MSKKQRKPQSMLTFVVRTDSDRVRQLRKELRHLAIDTGRTMSELMVEALDRLITAHHVDLAMKEEGKQ